MLAGHSSARGVWVVDSGASHHMCNSLEAFQPGSLRPVNHTIRLGDHTEVSATSRGTISIRGVTIEALFVPAFRVSLLSVSELDKLGWSSTFSNGRCSITDPRGTIVTDVTGRTDRGTRQTCKQGQEQDLDGTRLDWDWT